jgi:hypothetical protein
LRETSWFTKKTSQIFVSIYADERKKRRFGSRVGTFGIEKERECLKKKAPGQEKPHIVYYKK